MHAFPRLETPRLVLRELVHADIPALMTIYRDKAAMRWRGADCPASAEQVEQMVNWFANARQANSETQWGIERRSAPGIIGICGLRSWDLHSHQCLLGYELDPAQRGSGYMAEALSAVLDWAFFAIGFNRVTAYVHPDNGSSLRVLRKQAFRLEGLMRQAGRWDDSYHDLMGFSLLRADFQAVVRARHAVACPSPSPEPEQQRAAA